MEETTAPAGARNPSHLFSDDVDSISSLPDEILHHILSLIPTKLAITTGTLSKRWSHVWRETPCLSFSRLKVPTESITKTLASYSAAKIKSFHLLVDSPTCPPGKRNHHVDSLIKFAISRNVETLSLLLDTYYVFPDFFFNNPSLKQLIVHSKLDKMIPSCAVSWTSLRNLSLSHCIFSDESFPKILSGCPMLESLTLQYSGFLSCLDLSQSLRVTQLVIEFTPLAPRKFHIVAPPRIHYLRLIDFMSECSVADVPPSLKEADINTPYFLPRFWCIQLDLDGPVKDGYHVMLQAMLEKLQNVENLTVGISFLQMLSLADFRGVHFPTFKVKTLTLKTTILRSAVPGIAKLLQNSLGLKKIIFYKTQDWNTAVEKRVNSYLGPAPQDMIFPASSVFEVAKQDVVASFMELLLGNTRALETLVVQLGGYLNRSSFDELSQIALTLSNKYKVSVVLK